jgi:hypothetical protein
MELGMSACIEAGGIPSAADSVKMIYASLINTLDDLRKDPTASPEKKRLASIAITEAQGAEMWAAKAFSWKD